MSVGALANPTGLPDGFESYRRTDCFAEDTIPAGLLRDHCTKDDVWGLIHVIEGRLLYRITDPRRQPFEVLLSPESGPGLVEPTILHHVEPLGPVRFHVEFHRRAVEAAPLCRQEELALRENRLREEQYRGKGD